MQERHQTAAVWIRGIFERDYGVDFSHVQWFEAASTRLATPIPWWTRRPKGALMVEHDPFGVVGLGRLGLPIAERLLAAGYPVRGFDVSGDACAEASTIGVTLDRSPRELAAATRASLVLVGEDEDVRDCCVHGEDALLAGLDTGHMIVVCATVLPTTVIEVAEATRERGGDVLDAPLARGEQAVERGEALALCGGRADPFERWRPVLAEFCTDVIRLGDVGAGQVGKMVNNLLLWSTIAANHEGLRLAQRFGVDLDALRRGCSWAAAATGRWRRGTATATCRGQPRTWRSSWKAVRSEACRRRSPGWCRTRSRRYVLTSWPGSAVAARAWRSSSLPPMAIDLLD